MPLWLCLVGRLCVPHSVISTLSYFVQLYHLDYFDGRSNLDYVHKRTTLCVALVCIVPELGSIPFLQFNCNSDKGN